MESAPAHLQRAAGKFYDLSDGSPYNPAALLDEAAQYTLIGPDGTRYAISTTQGLTGITFADGVQWRVSDSGIAGPDNSTVGFIKDAQGRLTRVTTPDGRSFDYSYDAQGNLVSARNLSAGSSQRYAYADPASHRLTLVGGGTGGTSQVVSYAANGSATVTPVQQDLGAALSYLAQPITGQISNGGTQLYSFAVRNSEVGLPQGGAFLLGVEVAPTSGDFAPTLPQIDGATAIASGTRDGKSFAIFRLDEAGLQALRVGGTGSGGYTLKLYAVGDVNGDARVDGQDAALMSAARGSQQGDGTYVAAADLTRDGKVDQADAQLLYTNLGFAPNAAPVINAGQGFTHVDLSTRVGVASFLSDPEGDRLTYRIVGATHGVAQLSGDGTQVIFKPEAGYFGDASFTIVADDGYSQSAAGTVTVKVSNAPLLRIDFAQRRPEIQLGNAWMPDLIGDFADQQGALLDADYVTLSSTDPAVAKLLSNGALQGLTQGFSALVAKRGDITGATAIVVGEPSRFDHAQLFTGLDVYPEALSLVPEGFKPLSVKIKDGEAVNGAAQGTLYFSGNTQVVSVDAAGLVTGLNAAAAGGTTVVTVIYKGAEFVVPVHVQAPAQAQALIGEQGGAIQAADGAIVTIPPGAIDGSQTVSFTPVAESALPKAVPPGWTYLAAYDLDFEGDALTDPAQMAIKVPAGTPEGQQLFLMRYGDIPNAQGGMDKVWWQDEVLVVKDGVARTSSPPWRGVEPAGLYMLASPPPGATLANGKLTVNFPIGIFPIAATLPGVMATFSPFFAVSLDVGQISYVAIPKEGLPIVTTVDVKLKPGVINDVVATIAQPTNLLPKSPVLQSADFEFRQVDGATTPVAVLTGQQLSAVAGTAGSSQFAAVWRQQGKAFQADVVGAVTPLGNGREQIVVKIPQEVIAGIAELQLVRIDTVPGWDECAQQVVPVQKAYASNRITLPPGGDYVVAASYGIYNGVARSQLSVFTQGNPSSEHPEQTLQLAAEIPIGQEPAANVPYGFGRDTALTKDHTRAYVTLSGQHSVAVVDMLALQQVDADLTAAGINQIELPAGSSPFWIEIDKADHYAYVADENNYTDPLNPFSPKGRIYVIDIDPQSATFHKLVKTIEVDAAGRGLRQLLVSDDGKRLYAAAPNRDGSLPKEATDLATSRLIAINIDPADKPADPPAGSNAPSANPRRYWQQIGAFETGQETYALQSTGDPSRILYTDKYIDDPSGIGQLVISSQDPVSFSGTASPLLALTLGSANDTFDINNGQALLVLPANALKSAIGEHPEYTFVAGFNRFIQGSPAHDPDAGGSQPPAGSNIGIVRNGELVAATTSIPIGVIDNMAFASGYNYLFASYRGVSVGGGDLGAMFVYNLVRLIDQVETTYNSPDRSLMLRYPIEQFSREGQLPLIEDLNFINGEMNVRSDYRIIAANYAAGRFTYGVPYKMDQQGHYVDADGAVLPYKRNAKGQWLNADSSLYVNAQGWPATPPEVVASPFAPIATGGTPRGLSAHPTETAPGPRIWNQFALSRKWGIESRADLGVKDLLAEVAKPQDCPDEHYNSEVQLDTGAVVETHDLVSWQSMGQTQQLQLVYNSMSADASPILHFGWEGMAAEMQQYLQKAPASELSADGTPLLEVQITFNGEGGSLTTAPQYWKVPLNANDINVAMQADLSSLPSGYYGYTIKAKLFGKERTSTGGLMLDNKSDSVFGRGWTLTGLQELNQSPDGTLQIGDGGGNQAAFDAPPGVDIQDGTCADGLVQKVYTSRDNPANKLEQLSDGTYRRKLDDGTEYLYSTPTVDAQGKHVSGKLLSVKDRYGNLTRYDYDNAGRILTITDPAGLKTLFGYSGDKVTTITDPAGRVTHLNYFGKDLVGIVDPDDSERSFGYDAKGHMTLEINKLGGTETNTYGFHGRAETAHRPDGTEVEVSAWQVQGLADPADTATRETTAQVMIGKIDALKAKFTYANGNEKTVTFNERGQVLVESDSLGEVERFERDEMGNVLVATHGGHEQGRLHLRRARQPHQLQRRGIRLRRGHPHDV
ncbi:MAG: dockerin type I domain-containing protein [Aquabacterium sp.]